MGHAFPHLRVIVWLLRLPSRQTIDIPVVHAECCGNENSVVDLFIGCAVLPGTSDIVRSHLLATFLHLAGNV